MNEVLLDLDACARGARERLGADASCSTTLRHRGALRHVASIDDRSRRCDGVEVDRTGRRGVTCRR